MKPFKLILIVLGLSCSHLVTAQQQQKKKFRSSYITSTQRAIASISCTCMAPCILTQPNPQPVCILNGIATFTVAVSGTAPFNYQWRENAAIINDNAIYSGTNTHTLTITNAPFSLDGKVYRCVISNCSGQQVITSSAVLHVNKNVSDIDTNGITNVNDFNLLHQQFGNTCSGCGEDLNLDNLINNDDFLILLKEYGTSCQ
jgi:hypothetical protein